MSAQERPTSPAKPEVKPKPEIPPRSLKSDCNSPSGINSNVKEKQGRFVKRNSAEAEEQPVNGSADHPSSKQVKTPPETKPKPAIIVLPPQVETVKPPLPKKRSRCLKQQSESLRDENDGLSTDVRRSAPDGKEVEVLRTGSAEAIEEDTLYSTLSRCCTKTCACMCHLERPGMMLIWVPVDEFDNEPPNGKKREKKDKKGQKGENGLEMQALGQEGGLKAVEKEQGDKKEVEQLTQKTDFELNAAKNEDDENADGEIFEQINEGEPGKEVQNEAPDENNSTPALEEKPSKSQFKQSLEILLGGGPLAADTQGQTVPPQAAQPPLDDDEIYSLHLPELKPGAKRLSYPRFDLRDIPLFNVHKPAHREKHSCSNPGSTTDFEDVTEPPALPPRVPLTDDPVIRPSPGSTSSPPRVRPPPPPKILPPSSPVLPLRPPPAPPKPHPRKDSNVSMQPTILAVDDINGGKGDEERSPVGKKLSMKWENPLTDEPLYQTYNISAIQRSVIRNISKTSMDYATELVLRFSNKQPAKSKEGGIARSFSMSTANQSTLWQDQPAVRASGLLDQLTPEQIKYQESMFEVLTSETSYLRSLCVLIDHFMENRELGETLIINEKPKLFSNILKVREVSERFLKDLKDHIFQEIVFPDICNIIHYHAQHNFSTFIVYVRNQIYQEKLYSQLMKTNLQFATVINRLQELPQCQRLPFISFLLLPFQRITRIRMLIENILKRTKVGTTEEQSASKALASVSEIIENCNRDVGKMRQGEELFEISEMLEFDKLKAIPIVSETRFLEKKGELQEMSKSRTFVNMRARFSAVYLFLFNDHLLITVKKGSDRYVVLDHTHRSLVQAHPLDMMFGGAAYENCFNLVMLENHQGRMMERILKASSKSDMQRWLAAFPSGGQEDVEEEIIYEDWDCPQVQCVEQYIAQQADELSLEPTEIINVLRKTNEGWYEGIRLSDGQKGWFPDANVLEITNEHVRRRNVKERYRVSQATLMMKNGKGY